MEPLTALIQLTTEGEVGRHTQSKRTNDAAQQEAPRTPIRPHVSSSVGSLVFAQTHKFSVGPRNALLCKTSPLFSWSQSWSQPGRVHVRKITDKHSVYAHKATADISLLGVRMPPPPPPPCPVLPPLWDSVASFTVLPEPRWGWGGEGRSWRTLVWSGKKKKKRKMPKLELVTFSLSGFKCTHILQQSPSVSCSPLPVFCPLKCRTASCVFRTPSRPLLLCAQVWTFVFCFVLALTSNHLTRNEWMFESDCV